MKKVAGIFVGTLVVLSGGFAGYQLYETRHLSSDLKRTLTAATDEHATEADLRSYFHDARLQVHTKKDEEVLQKFEKAAQLAANSTEISGQVFHAQLRSIGDLSSGYEEFNRLIELRSQYWQAHVPVPKDLRPRIDKALADAKARKQQEQELQDSEMKRAESEQATAKALYNEVRSELGLPPLPKPPKKPSGSP